MDDIKIAKDCYLPKKEVKYYVAYTSNSVKSQIRRMRKEGKVQDFTFGKKILSVIFLETGEAILVNTAIDTLFQRMNPKRKKA